MFIISPEWIYLNNKKLEKGKALLIDESIIKEIIDKKTIKKKYKDIKIIEYTNHVLMPSLSESCIHIHNCIDKHQLDIKFNKLLNNGVTKVNLSTVSEDIMQYNFSSQLQLGQIIELNGKIASLSKIKNVTSLLDRFKSDPTKLLSISLININHFDEHVLKKISFIANEVNINLHINMNDIYNMPNDKELDCQIQFFEDINLMNNCYLHTKSYFDERWLKCIKRNNITLMISYTELDDFESLKSFISLLENKYKCILISNDSKSYKFYQTLNRIKLFVNDEKDLSIINKIIECVTNNTSELFSKYLSSGSIKKNNQASFNLFNYKKIYFDENGNVDLNLYNLDKESLTHVWSAGKQVDVKC